MNYQKNAHGIVTTRPTLLVTTVVFLLVVPIISVPAFGLVSLLMGHGSTSLLFKFLTNGKSLKLAALLWWFGIFFRPDWTILPALTASVIYWFSNRLSRDNQVINFSYYRRLIASAITGASASAAAFLLVSLVTYIVFSHSAHVFSDNVIMTSVYAVNGVFGGVASEVCWQYACKNA